MDGLEQGGHLGLGEDGHGGSVPLRGAGGEVLEQYAQLIGESLAYGTKEETERGGQKEVAHGEGVGLEDLPVEEEPHLRLRRLRRGDQWTSVEHWRCVRSRGHDEA